MINFDEDPAFELSSYAKTREAEKMAADGVPFEVICKMLNLSSEQIKFLRQSGDAHFK